MNFLRFYLLNYLLVVSSPCFTHSGLDCNLLCHWSDGISPFKSITNQTDVQVFLAQISVKYIFPP